MPQGHHVHVLLTQGQRLLEQLFPGIADELTQAGAPTIDWIRDWKMLGLWGWHPRFDSDLVGSACTRTLLETLIRQRLKAQPGFLLLEGYQVNGLLKQEAVARITGVKLHRRDSHQSNAEDQTLEPSSDDTIDTLSAALVVDASGRNSALPDWLSEFGYAAPPETIINSFLGYASRWYQCPPDQQVDWKGITVYATPGESS